MSSHLPAPSHPVSRQPTPDVRPRFDVDYRTVEDPGEGQRFSTWLDVQPLCRGPVRKVSQYQ